MPDLWTTNPAWRRIVNQVRTDLVPKLEASGAVVSIVPDGEGDVKFALELGFSIMLDKPIIAVVTPGRRVPERLVRVADRIVEGDVSTAEGSRRLAEVLQQIVREVSDDAG